MNKKKYYAKLMRLARRIRGDKPTMIIPFEIETTGIVIKVVFHGAERNFLVSSDIPTNAMHSTSSRMVHQPMLLVDINKKKHAINPFFSLTNNEYLFPTSSNITGILGRGFLEQRNAVIDYRKKQILFYE